jgi:hypothetical protein
LITNKRTEIYMFVSLARGWTKDWVQILLDRFFGQQAEGRIDIRLRSMNFASMYVYVRHNCQIFLGKTYQNEEDVYQMITYHTSRKCTKRLKNIPNIPKIPKYVYQIHQKFTNIFHSKALQKIPKILMYII